jgi:hypothetical protein
MFDRDSRYYGLPLSVKVEVGSDGEPRELAFVQRRFIRPAPGDAVLAEHTVLRGDRLDNITARYLGDPLQFWRICDANGVFRPDELTDEAGGIIHIPLPER